MLWILYLDYYIMEKITPGGRRKIWEILRKIEGVGRVPGGNLTEVLLSSRGVG